MKESTHAQLLSIWAVGDIPWMGSGKNASSTKKGPGRYHAQGVKKLSRNGVKAKWKAR